MPIKNTKELFVSLLSHLRHGTERPAAIYQELGELAQNPEIQEALAARAFVSQQTLAKLDDGSTMRRALKARAQLIDGMRVSQEVFLNALN